MDEELVGAGEFEKIKYTFVEQAIYSELANIFDLRFDLIVNLTDKIELRTF